MRRALLTIALLTSIASTARAEESAAVQAAERADWSVGAGLSFGTYYYGGSSYLTSTLGLSNNDYTSQLQRMSGPSASVFLERRLSRNWWFIGRANVYYSNWNAESDQDSRTASSVVKARSGSSTLGTLSVGLRSTVASFSRVDVSTYVIAGGTGYSSTTDATIVSSNTGSSADETSRNAHYVTRAWGAGVVGGFICDVHLLANLGVRLSTSLINVSFTSSNAEETSGRTDEKPIKAKGSGLDAGLSLSPSLEMRVLF